MNDNGVTPAPPASVLIVDGDIIVRHAIADVLRRCGYQVIEATNSDEAVIALQEPMLSIDIIVCDIGVGGARSGFGLAGWARQHRPELEVRLAGALESAANTVVLLCERGQHLVRPYEPEAVLAYIFRLRAESARMCAASRWS
jgi:DNA-binding response OmpR family regulator